MQHRCIRIESTCNYTGAFYYRKLYILKEIRKMSRNGKLEPMEVETMMNEARMLNNIIEVGERMIVSDKMEEARSKHDGREKAIISINPLLIHVPNWQRELRVSCKENRI